MLDRTTHWPHNVTRRTTAPDFRDALQAAADKLAAQRTTRVIFKEQSK